MKFEFAYLVVPLEASLKILPQLITAAHQLGNSNAKIHLVLLFEKDTDATYHRDNLGLEKVHYLETKDPFNFHGLTASLLQFFREQHQGPILFDHNPLSLEVATHLSSSLQRLLIPSVTSIPNDCEVTVVHRKIFGGNLLQKIALHSSNIIMTVQTTEFNPASVLLTSTDLPYHPIQLGSAAHRLEILSVEDIEKFIPLSDARIILAVGKGILNFPGVPDTTLTVHELQHWKYQQGFSLIQTLAATMGAAIGVTRALVDSGLAPYELQIGQTGKIVAPQQYIAFGISGAMQHTVGMRTSQSIIAINSNRNAPIFNVAHLGIVADMYDILPEWIATRQN